MVCGISIVNRDHQAETRAYLSMFGLAAEKAGIETYCAVNLRISVPLCFLHTDHSRTIFCHFCSWDFLPHHCTQVNHDAKLFWQVLFIPQDPCWVPGPHWFCAMHLVVWVLTTSNATCQQSGRKWSLCVAMWMGKRFDSLYMERDVRLCYASLPLTNGIVSLRMLFAILHWLMVGIALPIPTCASTSDWALPIRRCS